MTLEERIHDKIIIYHARQEQMIALEVAYLYFVLASRKSCKIKIREACLEAIRWLEKANINFPAYLEELSCGGQLKELENVLAKAKVTVE